MVETLDEILRKALEYHGSDIFVVPGSQIMTKSSGKMIPVTADKALPADIACNSPVSDTVTTFSSEEIIVTLLSNAFSDFISIHAPARGATIRPAAIGRCL